MLAIAGVAVGVMSEILVGSITEASESIGLSPFFVGVIVVAIVGNAAEHWVAVYFAARDKMDLSVNIAIGSSAQIALFVAPVLVLLSLRSSAPFPMALVFNGLELGAILLAVLIAQAGDAGGRVDLVRGPPAARGLRRARAHLLLRLMAAASRSSRAAAVARAGGRHGRPACGSTCTSSRAGASRRFREGVVWSIGWLVVSLLAGVVAARARPTARRRGHLHDRLLHRALAVARQPVRLPPAVRVLRRAERVPGAAAVLGHRRGARAARAGDPRRRRADRAVPLRHLRARRAAARPRLPDPARASTRTSTPTSNFVVRLVRGSSRSRGDSTASSWFVQQRRHGAT